MEFIHRPFVPGETVSAVATPPGEGGVAIIRISGNEAIDVASKIFSGDVKSYQSHTVHFGKIQNFAKEAVDDVLLVVMKGPRSFTGEDTVEIQCHGGRLITEKVLELTFQAGARPAFPGEFSFKAYMNGKMDLAQAEAIQALIHAKNEKALGFAQDHLAGSLSKKIRKFQKHLSDTAAILEAWVDFPEEGLEFAPFEEVVEGLENLHFEMEKLIKTFHQGRIIHDGINLALVGSPNVGKSSLMNALLGKERAIVSPIAGTTRDLIEDDLRLNGLHFKLVDTAGIRETDELIEEEGIRRSKRAIEKADVILFVLDVTQKVEMELIEALPQTKTIAIWNKIDLQHERPLQKLPFNYITEVSVENEIGLETIHSLIEKQIQENSQALEKDEVVLTNLRHKESLVSAAACLRKVIDGLKGDISPEFLAFDMRGSLTHLGAIIGTNVTEDVLTAIFSRFCIGK